ncbi:MAG: hypothetical protein AB1405_11300 [Bdellovibrionota bacterium]
MPCPLHQNSPAPAPSEAAVKLVRSEKFVKDVCGKVEKGCTPHVVAFAKGLPLKDFWTIWALGLAAEEKEEKDRDEREKTFAQFVHQVQLALAEARIDAEMRVHKKSPHVYLESSPACTGGGSWKRKRNEPPTDEERFERNPLEYLRYAESCIAGPYSLDPAARKEFETPCVQCQISRREEAARIVSEAMKKVREEKARKERGAGELAPPPLGEGAAERRERADRAGTTLSDSALSRDFGLGASRPGGATLSQGERGMNDPENGRGPGP